MTQKVHRPARPLVRRMVKAVRRARRPVRWGNLRREHPFSERYGLDRGTSIDRPYIDEFIASHADDIRGRVLEIRDRRYTQNYGTEVLHSDVLDIDPQNKDATIVADLAEIGCLPETAFDCLIVTQTLHLIADVRSAFRNLWTALRPGGVLLLSVPTLCRLDPDLGWQRDYWRFTPAGLDVFLRHLFPTAHIEISGRGNVTAAIAFIAGLAREELTSGEHSKNDPSFSVVTLARVQKPAI